MEVILTVDQTARLLNLAPAEIVRLIARGDLNATAVGCKGPWRIRAAILDQFIAAGAPGVDAPSVDASAGWLVGPGNRQAIDEFAETIKTLGAGESLDAAKLARRAESLGPTDASIEVEVPFTPAMAEAFKGPSPQSAEEGQFAEPWLGLKKIGTHFCVYRLRELAGESIDPIGGVSKLQQFYASPETYSRFVGAAWKRFDGAAVAWRENRKIADREITVVYRVPYAAMISTDRRETIARLAF